MSVLVYIYFSYHISHILVTTAILSEGYIAIVHDAISSYTDTIPWLVEEKNTLNCKLSKDFLDYQLPPQTY